MKRAGLILAALLIIGYGAFEARKLLSGPEIVILSPKDGSATSSDPIIISGIAQNISFLTVNDNPSYTDEQGRFSVVLSPPLGYAIFTVAATDRFGRSARAAVRVVVLNYCPIQS